MPIFHVVPLGNLGNRMIQFLVAKSLESRLSDCRISNAILPDWGIDYPQLPISGKVYEHRDAQYIYPVAFQALFSRGKVGTIIYSGYGQRVENFQDFQTSSRYFRSALTGKVGYDDDHLVINIRGGEVLDGRHPHYVLVPIDFYKDLIERTRLRPIFMGQIEDNVYCRALRHAFPQAEFLTSQGAIQDFEVLRGSVNLVPAVSTFSWLACWLSERAKNIYMPLTGLFNPLQNRHHNFAPTTDSRFRFFLFPANFSSPVSDYELDHRALLGRYEQIDPGALRRLMERPSRTRNFDRHMAVFDEGYYLARYADIREALSNGLASGLVHYSNSGFNERRDAFAFDHHWYVQTYPQAAREIGRGEFEGARHHFVEAGSLRGYRPVPSD